MMKEKGERFFMLSHFTYKPLFQDQSLPGWYIRFYYQGTLYEATYHKDGKVEWRNEAPASEDTEKIISHIHELMLYHIYD
jgi:hypothetical protein